MRTSAVGYLLHIAHCISMVSPLGRHRMLPTLPCLLPKCPCRYQHLGFEYRGFAVGVPYAVVRGGQRGRVCGICPCDPSPAGDCAQSVICWHAPRSCSPHRMDTYKDPCGTRGTIGRFRSGSPADWARSLCMRSQWNTR